MITEKCNGEGKMSEFDRIISDLKNEMLKTEYSSSLILDKTCKIREFRELEPCPDDVKKCAVEDECILNDFESIIRRMRNANNILDTAIIGLNKFIG